MSAGTTRTLASAATSSGPMRDATLRLGKAPGKRALSNVGDKVSSVTENLTSIADGNGGGLGGGGLMGALGMGKKGGKPGKGKGGKIKVTTIIESVDVGVPLDVAYDQWTRFTDFPSFMKKIEHVEQNEDDKLTWQAQVFWSHRTWDSTIVEQTPEERIVWRSSGAKGYADGAVTFHELAPSLTRIVLVLEYNPKGLFEHVGNIWRAQGRRARLELKHFQRHVMTQTILHPEELEGWRGEIHDGEVTPPEEVEGDENEPEEGTDEEVEGEHEGDDEGAENGEDTEEGEYEDEYEDEDEDEGDDEYEDEEEDVDEEDEGRGAS